IQDWSVMTDELLYAKLATAIAESGSPLPRVHDTSISVFNQLYPLLLAPLFGARSPPDAFRAAHVLNAVVMTSAVFPAYLLARQVLSRLWAFAVAVLTVLVPWMVIAGFLMTEAVAYPAFLWMVLGLQLAIANPTRRHDLLAVGALALGVLARTQFAALVLVLPLAILGHEVGRALTAPGSDSRVRRLLDGARKAVARHRLLAAVYGVGLVAAAIVVLVGSAGSLLGVYGVTLEEGSLLPAGVWSSAARHLDAVAIGCGVAPLVLGGGWMLATVVRPLSRTEHALAMLSLTTVVVLTLEAASFGVRFGTDIARDRYLFYVAPLLLIGSAAALATPRRHVAVAAALVTIFFAASVPLLDFTVRTGIWVDSPASVLNDILIEQSGGLGTGAFVALLGLFLGLVLVLGLVFAPRLPLALALLAALVAFSVLTLRSEVDRVVAGTGLSGRPLAGPPGLVLEWVDTVVPNDEQAALIAFPVSTAWDTTAIRWWDVELWNRTVTRAYVAADGNFRYTPFPHRTLAFDWTTGEAADTLDAPRFVVAAPGDSRFQLAGRERAANLGFVVRAVERPYRAVWLTRGLETDGWTKPGRPATIRVYARSTAGTELVRLRISAHAPTMAPARYRITVQGETHIEELAPSTAGREDVVVCVPASSFADLTIAGLSSARIEGLQLSPEVRATRSVGVGLGPISVRPLGVEC
ncbi:MAG: hypothetical protein H0U08_10120, partial [Actinobacteria bacterium]|nr:hypothetical protein [Actinomycetota bacterium]